MREPFDLYIECGAGSRVHDVMADLVHRGIPFDWRPAEGVASRIFVVCDNEEHMKYLVAVYALIPVRMKL